MGANSSHPSRQPPVDAPGTAVLYIRGFSYTSKAPCSCARPELLATTSGSSNARLDTSRLPQELQLAGGITPQEFADNYSKSEASMRSAIFQAVFGADKQRLSKSGKSIFTPGIYSTVILNMQIF